MIGFTFDSTHSSEYGVYFRSVDRTLLPAKRITQYTIPGRSGTYDVDNGYENRDIALTIPTSTWINGENTIPVDGLSANSNGMIGCSAAITAEQLAAAKLAELSISGQSDGNITIKASGTVPSVDIPVTLTIIG